MARKKIGDILIEKGLISREQLAEALKKQDTSGHKVGQILVENGLITEDQLIQTMSERLEIPKISLESIVIDPLVVGLIPVEVARRYCLIPVFRIGNVLTVAMADPLNIIAIEELKYLTKCDIKRVITSRSKINAAIDQYYSVADSLSGVIGTYSGSQVESRGGREPRGLSIQEDEAPVVKLVNLLISQAVKAKASDVHIEPDEGQVRVRYRVNGVMKEEASPPKKLQSEIVSRIKVAANMDVSEKRLPQDGRLLVTVDDADIDLRVSTLPTIHGEKVVIRILDRRVISMSLDELGFSGGMLESWKKLIQIKEGLILCTGPTSSGKTTTLYSVLRTINSVEKNIITIEDPVEYSLPLINQVQTNEKAGLTFASSLRSILRQNPDIIMIGEIRDSETAIMAIRSALTGHLVLSTMHTNDAPSGIVRLIDMGIEKYLVASALKGILAQRLVRTNCPHCLEKYRPQEMHLRLANLLDSGEEIQFMRGAGCTRCRMTGYVGQTGIFEQVTVDDTMAEMILNNAGDHQIRNYALTREYKPLFEAGLENVRKGEVCLEELLRVISISEAVAVPSRRQELINA
ncbi:MAG: Flp pilus assembly complex ATPase component TadA [Candidatus Zixiibacteriota bacterium]|nr:MAG: Flp pilus assembly complex ATPase component TadA [candidate division Zixibacteria bacterium]